MRTKVVAGIIAAVILVLVAIPVAYAYAAYHGNWAEQPYWGNWWWYNQTYLTWDVDDYWTPSRADALHSGHNNWPYKEYRFEQEAYKPEGPSSCDRLDVYQIDTIDLPVTGFSISNGCGSDTVREEVRFQLDENRISADVWYRHRVKYEKQNPGTGGDGEVNYSFTHNWEGRDSWLGKVVYDQWFNKISSDPDGLVN